MEDIEESGSNIPVYAEIREDEDGILYSDWTGRIVEKNMNLRCFDERRYFVETELGNEICQARGTIRKVCMPKQKTDQSVWLKILQILMIHNRLLKVKLKILYKYLMKKPISFFH
ncbi:MAG: hypothetical protein Ta2E_13300 [Mycoplasmoidaceae bacterium]|nr:MAG: hypothetical protein Ta2E_13300 [Mycoplasmoidaceae bacterium]